MRQILWMVLVGCAALTVPAQWHWQKLDTQAGFRGLSVVSNKVIWASGTEGTFVKTTDGGLNWSAGTVPDAEKLDFRDVEAFDADTAYLLSIGTGESSRIYKTTDGGQNWQLQFQNKEPEAIFDALAFWDKQHGLALSDPVRGRFLILRTDDGGAHWTPVPAENIPPAVAGEGGFAASGTCLITSGKDTAYLVSGGAAARVYRTTDKGLAWRVFETPVLKGSPGAGIFSIACRKGNQCVVVGGDYQKSTQAEKNAAFSTDGGATWQAATRGPAGYRSGAAFARDGRLVAVGTSGTDESRDGGRTWNSLDAEDFNAVAFAPDGTLWAAGPKGRLAWRK